MYVYSHHNQLYMYSVFVSQFTTQLNSTIIIIIIIVQKWEVEFSLGSLKWNSEVEMVWKWGPEKVGIKLADN